MGDRTGILIHELWARGSPSVTDDGRSSLSAKKPLSLRTAGKTRSEFLDFCYLGILHCFSSKIVYDRSMTTYLHKDLLECPRQPEVAIQVKYALGFSFSMLFFGGVKRRVAFNTVGILGDASSYGRPQIACNGTIGHRFIPSSSINGG